jgi:wyosine [tRNA(Phe)-imidazoG37] synthetase (radical SAM superfamily)
MTTPSSTEKSPLQSTPSGTLTTRNHDRDIAGMTYVYPVLSRRAGGISVGINLNPNNACNWRCVYCQVPNLTRGGPPPIDLVQLEDELRRILDDILHGDFMLRSAPPEMRRLNDVALSGNGEPTSAPEFSNVVDLIGTVLADFALIGKIKLVLITNGSLANKPQVQAGLRKMAQLNGEVWFKFDRATRTGLQQVNDTETEPERHYQRLQSVAQLCPTWIQTCMFGFDGVPPAETEIEAWLTMLARAKTENLPLQGVLLYGLARPSLQAESSRLSRLPEEWLRALAARVEQLGWTVQVSV